MFGPEDKKDSRPEDPGSTDQPTAPYRTPSAATPVTEWDTTAPSWRLLAARFEILGKLGRGGMGIVYKARDRETGEVVALKVLKPEIAAAADVVERFKNELRLARKITHKNVCRTHDLHRFGEVAVIAMESVEGESLRHILSRFAPLSVRKGTEWAGQICAALKEAHAQGIVHRDLKPENVMLDASGHVKVMDFGIARSLEVGATTTGSVVGTPAYMAPEQAEGKPVDHRADIYALGVMLYEMFTGETPFKGDTPVAVAFKQVHATPPRPRQLEPTLPEHIEQAILKCLEKDPAKRFTSAEELEAALTRKPEAKPAVVTREEAEIPLPARLMRWQRSDRYVLALALVGLAAFFLLYDRAFPYSAVRVMPREKALQVAKEALAKLHFDAGPQGGQLLLTYVAAEWGPELARALLSQGEASGWVFELSKARSPDGWPGGLTVNQAGVVTSIYMPGPVSGLRKDMTLEQFRESAAAAIAALYGEDTHQIKVEEREHERGNALVGYLTVPDPKSKLTVRYAVGTSKGADWWYLNRMVVVPHEARAPLRGAGWSRPWGAAAALFFLSAILISLFFIRRLHRRPVSPAPFTLALLLTITVAAAFPRKALGSVLAYAILPNKVISAGVVVLFFLVVYGCLATVEYYLSRSDLNRLRTFSQLIRQAISTPPAGLAILRGAALGFAFTGLFVILIAGASWLRLAFPVTPEGWEWPHVRSDWLQLFVFRPEMGPWMRMPLLDLEDSPVKVAAQTFTVMFCEAFVLIWLLVGLPAALARRASLRPGSVVAVATALWLVVGFSLQGAFTFPGMSLYVSILLQALFFSLVYNRWDLLTTAIAAFTVETWLVGYVVVQLFWTFDSVFYGLPVILWMAFVLFGGFLYFRNQLASGWRRVAEVLK